MSSYTSVFILIYFYLEIEKKKLRWKKFKKITMTNTYKKNSDVQVLKNLYNESGKKKKKNEHQVSFYLCFLSSQYFL